MGSPDRLSDLVKTDRGTIRIRRGPNGDGQTKPLTIIGGPELSEPPVRRFQRLLTQAIKAEDKA